MGKWLNGPFINLRAWNFRPMQPLAGEVGKKFKMVFLVKNENKIEMFYLRGKLAVHVLLLETGRVHF